MFKDFFWNLTSTFKSQSTAKGTNEAYLPPPKGSKTTHTNSTSLQSLFPKHVQPKISKQITPALNQKPLQHSPNLLDGLTLEDQGDYIWIRALLWQALQARSFAILPSPTYLVGGLIPLQIICSVSWEVVFPRKGWKKNENTTQLQILINS